MPKANRTRERVKGGKDRREVGGWSDEGRLKKGMDVKESGRRIKLWEEEREVNA